MFILYIILAIISGLLYHLGGLGNEGAKKYPKLPKWLFNTKMRDWGCAACNVTLVAGLFKAVVWWQFLGVFLFSWLFLTTYHDWLNRFFNKPAEGDVYWFNWFAHGFCLGLPLLFILYTNPLLVGLICLSLGIGMMIWSQLISLAWLEEFGRGYLFIFIPVLFFVR
jgi:hypothetical protein